MKMKKAIRKVAAERRRPPLAHSGAQFETSGSGEQRSKRESLKCRVRWKDRLVLLFFYDDRSRATEYIVSLESVVVFLSHPPCSIDRHSFPLGRDREGRG